MRITTAASTLFCLGVGLTLPACVETPDDTTVSDLSLSEEYVRAVELIGLTLPELWRLDRYALEVAFAEEVTLAPLRAAFDAWAAGIPELDAGYSTAAV